MPIRRLDRPSLPCSPCVCAAPRPSMSFGSCMLDSPSLDRPFLDTPNPGPGASALALGATMPNHPAWREWYGGRTVVSWRELRPLGDSCGRPEPARRDADEALEVTAKLALVGEPGV